MKKGKEGVREWGDENLYYNLIFYYIKIDHPAFLDLLTPLLELQKDVSKKAALRLEYDGLSKIEALKNYRGETSSNRFLKFYLNSKIIFL